MHSVVALLDDLSGQGLKRRMGDDGKAYPMVALKAEQMIALHHEPTHQVA